MINQEGSDATNKPKQPVLLAHHHYEASSLVQCNHILSLLDAGQLAYQISTKTFVNHSTISILHFIYFPCPYKPYGGHPSKLSPADNHYVQQLIGSWKAGNGAHIAKALVDVKTQPLIPYIIDFNLEQLDLGLC